MARHKPAPTILGATRRPRLFAENVCGGNAGILDRAPAGYAAPLLGDDERLCYHQRTDRGDLLEGGLLCGGPRALCSTIPRTERLSCGPRRKSSAIPTDTSTSAVRLHYDWSDPTRVVLTTTDSNVWGGASDGHIYSFTRQPNGTTDIDAVVIRDGKNLTGRMLGFVLGTIGRRVLEKAFENSIKAIEARHNKAERLDAGHSSIAA